MHKWLLLFLALSAPAAEAATTDKTPQLPDTAWAECRDTSTLAAVKACTAVIMAGTNMTNPQLAEAYYNRGSAWFRNSYPRTLCPISTRRSSWTRP